MNVRGGGKNRQQKHRAETAVHDCHCPGEMAVPMGKVLARPRVGVRVCHSLFIFTSIYNFRAH